MVKGAVLLDHNEIIRILKNVNEEILNYNGSNLFEDHILNSFDVIEIISEIENILGIDIDPELIVWNRFATKETIIEFIREAEKNSMKK